LAEAKSAADWAKFILAGSRMTNRGPERGSLTLAITLPSGQSIRLGDKQAAVSDLV
jgi:hypothetical protein